MKNSISKSILSYILFNLILITIITECNDLKNITNSNVEDKLKRGKRYLDFVQKSRMFFRANVKNNMIKVNQIWAHAFGFRANYPIENDKEHRPFRRDVYETIENLIDFHGLDGKACVLKSFCETLKADVPKSGMLFKIFKLIFKLQEKDRRHFPYLNERNCNQLFHQHCPLVTNNILLFTDL